MTARSARSAPLRAAIDEAIGVLGSLADLDWTAPAGTLEWSCAQTAVHVANDLAKYAAQLAGRVEDSYLAFDLVVADGASPRELIRIVEAATELLVAVVDVAPDDARAWHWGPTDHSGFVAMAIGELLVHTYDITSGLGVEWRPPPALADAVLRRLMPDVKPSNDDPAAALLWSTGRIDLEDRPHVESWMWRAATA